MNLKDIARASIKTQEGLWLNTLNGTQSPCCMIIFTIESTGKHDGVKGRFVVNNQIICVSGMPKLETILYIKKTDEIINPLFRKKRIASYTEVYNLESGDLDYLHKDRLADKMRTKLLGDTHLAKQGKEVCNVLQVISSIYYGKKDVTNTDANMKIHVNIDGVVKPFTLKTKEDTAKVPFLDDRISCIRVDVLPENGFLRHKACLSVWAASFRDITEKLDNEVLTSICDNTPQWSMIPLVTDYDLFIGSARCSITNITSDNL